MKLDFKKLWQGYSRQKVQGNCDRYANQCAIRMSDALHDAGLDVSKGYQSKNICVANDITHIRGAQTLAIHLKKVLKRRPLIYKRPQRAEILLKGKKGIVFFKDIAGFRNGIGDHIDLWNGKKTKTGAYWHKCKEVWFWEL